MIRTFSGFVTFFAFASVAAIGVWGCSAAGGDTSGSGTTNSSNAASVTSGAGGAGGDGGATSSGALTTVGVGSGGAPPEEEITEVYGHSPSVLYKLEPETKAVTVIGTFNGCSSVIDIAIDENNDIVGTTSSGLWAIDRQTAACSQIASGSYPNSLSYVPKGTLDADVEALVGYQGANYVRIDPTSGTVTTIGSLSGGYASSGDIVSVKDGGTYLTVTGPSCSDCLVEVNPVTGDLIQNLGSLGYGQVFGIAFWGGRAYGFSNGGVLFEIALDGTLATTPINIPNSPPDLQFWGAGSSTSVPIRIPE